MRFICESCKANLQIADEKVRAKRLIVRSKRCGVQIRIADPALSGGAAPRAVSSAASHAGARPATGPIRGSSMPAPGAGTKATPPPTDTESTRAMDSEVLERALRASKEDDAATGRTVPPRAVPPPPPRRATPPSGNQPIWFAMVHGDQIGPLARVELGRKAAAGEITPRTYLWKEGMRSWLRAKDLQEVVSAFAAHPLPRSTAIPTPLLDPKIDLPFDAVSEALGGAETPAPAAAAPEELLHSPDSSTPPGGVTTSAEGPIPPLAADADPLAEAEALEIAADADGSTPGALDLARWGAAELERPRAETPVPANARVPASSFSSPAFRLAEARRRGPLRFVVAAAGLAGVVALVAFALFYGRNDAAPHPQLAQSAPAHPAETKPPEHKAADAVAEPAGSGPALSTDVLKR